MNTAANDIRPFRIQIDDAAVDDLRHRLRHTRWPSTSVVEGWERGVPQDYLQGLAAYWSDAFDWRARERRLNRLDQFVTDVDGQAVHFVHVRSSQADAVPLLMIHGWPSTPFEFDDVVGSLTDPARDEVDGVPVAFHVVAPSLPGYGFSTPLAGAGWGNLFRVAQAFAEIMERLGYERYLVHGTDAGAGVAGLLGMVAPERVIGVHLTGTAPAMPFGPPIDAASLTGADRRRAERFNEAQEDAYGYLHLQSTRPQTLAYALADSPVAQLAWIAEKFHEWTDPEHELPDEAVDRDALLTAVSIAWFTGAGGSSAHATYEGMQVYRQMAAAQDGADAAHETPSGPPTGVAVFAADNTVRSILDPAGAMVHWREYDRGGHFPGMETPELLVADLDAFARLVVAGGE
ncbi:MULTISPECIES: epoxide hydrolase family protein [Microbacterium]|uniref:epoxide hydrolase family protein n=1 Tax=Microbacterium TaxID=33882 RepID=UPI000D651696|nr:MULTISPECIES: epoxide hydrolase family protein [Microbacterium]